MLTFLSFKENKLLEVSINIFDNDCYAFQPLYKLDKNTLQAWKDKVEEFVQNGNVKVYAENALNEITQNLNIQGMSYKDDYIDICIRDYGPGIPEDELALVKKKFYKGSSKARGSGIGLAVSDEIVQMHGGELILENALSGGTLVTVRLPATQ